MKENTKWEDYLLVDFDNPVYVNPLLGKEKMQYYYRKSYRDFYFDPKYILNMFLKIRSYGDIKRYWRGLRAVTGFLGHS